MPDKFTRRSGDDYAHGFASLLPVGRAWPREPDSVLMRLVSGEAQIWGDKVDARAGDLLERETDPRYTIEMLLDWERAFGLPDLCLAEPTTLDDRRDALLARITEPGGQSRAYFYGIAARLGYRIEIFEYAPFMAGISEVGDTRPIDEILDFGFTAADVTSTDDWGLITEQADEFLECDVDIYNFRWVVGPEEIRFYWRVHILDVRFSWFRATSGECGVDPHLSISLATDLECLFRRYKPAQTDVVFDYSGLSDAGPLAGLP